MAKVTIVGAGFMGTAVAYPLADNGHTVRLVGTHLDNEIIESCRAKHFHPKLKRELPLGVKSYFVDDIAEALDGAEIIVSGVNSLGMRWIGQAIGPHLKPGQLIIAITKGLEAAENGDLLILPDVLAGELPENIRDKVKLVAVGGPCIAGELAGRRQTCVVYGSRDAEAVEQLATTFRTPYYHIWTTTDLVGLEVCAALKNAYTLGVGMAGGLLEKAGGPDAANASMHNLAAATFGQACTEMSHALALMGGTPAFAYGLPGAGDLYVTCMGGRTVRLGHLLGLGHTLSQATAIMAGETLESVEIIRAMAQALPKLRARGLIDLKYFPLIQMLGDVVVGEKPVDFCLDAYMKSAALTNFGGAG
ncbi:MAG: glycerol-3-phosphate dehydrogenase [Anaerolineae bacterium]|nr:glycerol-3-phosphate dehydrogenase [Anaerolineae bacterium]